MNKEKVKGFISGIIITTIILTLSLTLSATERVVDFCHQVIVHAGHNNEKQPYSDL